MAKRKRKVTKSKSRPLIEKVGPPEISENCVSFNDDFNPISINENSTIVIQYPENQGFLAQCNEITPISSKQQACKNDQLKRHESWFQYYTDVEGLNFVCTGKDCLKKYRTVSGIKAHAKSGNCPINENKRFRCPFEGCNNRYKGSSGLSYHLSYFHNVYLRNGGVEESKDECEEYD